MILLAIYNWIYMGFYRFIIYLLVRYTESANWWRDGKDENGTDLGDGNMRAI